MASNEVISEFVQAKDVATYRQMLTDGSITNIDVIDSSTDDDYTALMYQSQHGTPDMIEFLLTWATPASIDLQNKDGKTALHYAAYNDKPDNISLLLEHGADRSMRTHKEGQTPVSLAMSKNHKECVRLLVKGPAGKTR